MTIENKDVQRIEGSGIDSQLLKRQLGFDTTHGKGDKIKMKYRTHEDSMISFTADNGDAAFNTVSMNQPKEFIKNSADNKLLTTKEYVDDKVNNAIGEDALLNGFVNPSKISVEFNVDAETITLTPLGTAQEYYTLNDEFPAIPQKYILASEITKTITPETIGKFFVFLKKDGLLEVSSDWLEGYVPIISGYRLASANSPADKYPILTKDYHGTAMGSSTKHYVNMHTGAWIEWGCDATCSGNVISRVPGSLVNDDVAHEMAAAPTVNPALLYMTDANWGFEKYETISPSSGWLSNITTPGGGTKFQPISYNGDSSITPSTIIDGEAGKGTWYLYFVRPDARGGEWNDFIVPMNLSLSSSEKYSNLSDSIQETVDHYISFAVDWKVLGLFFVIDGHIEEYHNIASLELKDLLHGGIASVVNILGNEQKQSDWDELDSSSSAFIRNKPELSIGSNIIQIDEDISERLVVANQSRTGGMIPGDHDSIIGIGIGNNKAIINGTAKLLVYNRFGLDIEFKKGHLVYRDDMDTSGAGKVISSTTGGPIEDTPYSPFIGVIMENTSIVSSSHPTVVEVLLEHTKGIFDKAFIELRDSPSSYNAQQGKAVTVNSSANGVEFKDLSSKGSFGALNISDDTGGWRDSGISTYSPHQGVNGLEFGDNEAPLRAHSITLIGTGADGNSSNVKVAQGPIGDYDVVNKKYVDDSKVVAFDPNRSGFEHPQEIVGYFDEAAEQYSIKSNINQRYYSEGTFVELTAGETITFPTSSLTVGKWILYLNSSKVIDSSSTWTESKLPVMTLYKEAAGTYVFANHDYHGFAMDSATKAYLNNLGAWFSAGIEMHFDSTYGLKVFPSKLVNDDVHFDIHSAWVENGLPIKPKFVYLKSAWSEWDNPLYGVRTLNQVNWWTELQNTANGTLEYQDKYNGGLAHSTSNCWYYVFVRPDARANSSNANSATDPSQFIVIPANSVHPHEYRYTSLDSGVSELFDHYITYLVDMKCIGALNISPSNSSYEFVKLSDYNLRDLMQNDFSSKVFYQLSSNEFNVDQGGYKSIIYNSITDWQAALNSAVVKSSDLGSTVGTIPVISDSFKPNPGDFIDFLTADQSPGGMILSTEPSVTVNAKENFSTTLHVSHGLTRLTYLGDNRWSINIPTIDTSSRQSLKAELTPVDGAWVTDTTYLYTLSVLGAAIGDVVNCSLNNKIASNLSPSNLVSITGAVISSNTVEVRVRANEWADTRKDNGGKILIAVM